MPIDPLPPLLSDRARCRNCKKFFMRRKYNQVFCKQTCRNNFHNYGKTPQQQVETRLKAFMRTEDFRELMRDTVRKEIEKVLAGYVSDDGSDLSALFANGQKLPKGITVKKI